MRPGIAAGLLVVFALGSSAPAMAQVRRPPREPRGFVSVSGGVQNAAAISIDSFNFELHAEDGTIRAEYPGNTATLLDVGAGMRIWRRFGVGAGVSRASASGDAPVTATVPHPFFLARHREVEGTASGISRTETAVHVQVYWEPRLTGRWRFRIFGGPSFFDVEQDVVEAVEVDESYPFDTATFRRARTAGASASGPGGHAGFDVSWMLSRQVGAGALLRYARASLDLNAPASRSVSSDGGGLQLGAGLRVLF